MAFEDELKVANGILGRCWDNDIEVTQLQLQKLAFIAHGWHLAVFGNPLVPGEPFRAWKFGPVLPSLYDEFRECGAQPIGRFGWMYGEDGPEEPFFHPLDDASETLDFVVAQYGKYNGPELVNLTHRPGTPWHDITHGGRSVGFDKTINDQLIKNHYKRLLADSQK